MKFKVGDKVRIRKDLKYIKNYDELDIVSAMEEYAGRIMTIKRTVLNGYYFEEDHGTWLWLEDTIEGFAVLTKEELLAMPLGTIIITDREEHNIFVKVGENDFCNNNADHIFQCHVEEDLTINRNHFGNKIIEIQEPTYNTIYKADKEVKEMTMAELEKELGYPVKIIKED